MEPVVNCLEAVNLKASNVIETKGTLSPMTSVCRLTAKEKGSTLPLLIDSLIGIRKRPKLCLVPYEIRIIKVQRIKTIYGFFQKGIFSCIKELLP